jgi:hypothetical protein
MTLTGDNAGNSVETLGNISNFGRPILISMNWKRFGEKQSRPDLNTNITKYITNRNNNIS